MTIYSGTEVEVITLPLGSYQANCYIVHKPGNPTCVVIDPGAESEKIIAALDAHDLRCELIVLTHRHHDHIGAVNDLVFHTKAPVCIGVYDAREAQSPEGSLGLKMVSNYREALKRCAPHPDKELIDGDKLLLGEMNFQVFETPGHTAGSICLMGEGCLFAGDTLFKGSMGRTDFPSGDERAMLKSLYRLAQLPCNIRVFPGHGPSTTIGEELTSNQFLMYAAAHPEFAEER